MREVLEATSLDGNRVILATPGAAGGPPASCAGIAQAGPRRLDLAWGSHAHGERRAALVGVALDEEYDYRGGRLRVGTRVSRTPSGVLDRVRTGVWEGRRQSLSFHLNGPTTTADVLAVLEELEVEETTDGVRVQQRDGEPLPFADGPTVLKPVSGVGVFEIAPLTSRLARWLPRWTGTSVFGGELFVDDPRGPRMQFLLVTETALASLVPTPQANPDLVADQLASTTVSWGTRAAGGTGEEVRPGRGTPPT